MSDKQIKWECPMCGHANEMKETFWLLKPFLSAKTRLLFCANCKRRHWVSIKKENVQ